VGKRFKEIIVYRRVTTVVITTFRITVISITTFRIMAFSIMALRIMTLRIMTLSIMTFRKMALSIMPLRITTLSIMALRITTLRITTLKIPIKNARLNITTIRIWRHLAKCRYAEYRFAEVRGAIYSFSLASAQMFKSLGTFIQTSSALCSLISMTNIRLDSFTK
jgi:hypothetical protein